MFLKAGITFLKAETANNKSRDNDMIKKLLYIIMVVLLASCGSDDPSPSPGGEPDEPGGETKPTLLGENLIVCNEGNWQSDNGQLSFYDGTTGVMTNKWFRKVNGSKIGDTPNDILHVNDTLIAITVNWSNIIQYIHPDGTACGATENVPNNRRMCSDGRYLYVTSYAHKCGSQTFTRGYVAKIDLHTKLVVDTCHVGYEPEGIAYYDGRLYVANTGGYSTQTQDHGYEQTVSVVDAQTMRELRRIDTGCKNLYGAVAQWREWLCINAAGDMYNTPPHTVVLNMASEEFRVYDFPSTYCCAAQGRFYCLGSAYSHLTGEYAYSTHTIALPSLAASEGLADYADADAVIASMQSPYALYISPFSAHMYVSDARAYATNGYVYEFSPTGALLNRYLLRGVNPSSFVAL